MAYYANMGPDAGPLRARAGYFAIGVVPARQIRSPIGLAVADGQSDDGLTRWRLTIHEAELPGLWIVIDREFRPAG